MYVETYYEFQKQYFGENLLLYCDYFSYFSASRLYNILNIKLFLYIIMLYYNMT